MATARRAKPKPATPEPLSERARENMKRDLIAATRRADRDEARASESKAQRDRVIRDAMAAKMPRAEIIASTGLSPARIDQINRDARL